MFLGRRGVEREGGGGKGRRAANTVKLRIKKQGQYFSSVS